MRTVIFSSVCLVLIGCQSNQDTPLTRAAATGTPADVARTLLGASPGELQTALIAGSRAGNADAIPLLVKAGADVTRAVGRERLDPTGARCAQAPGRKYQGSARLRRSG